MSSSTVDLRITAVMTRSRHRDTLSTSATVGNRGWGMKLSREIIAVIIFGAIASVVATFTTNEAMPVILSWLGYPPQSNSPFIVRAGVYASAVLLPFIIVITGTRVLPLLLQTIALCTVAFLALGFRTWARRNGSIHPPKDLWAWIADQILVAQGRHAFSIECIAFVEDGSKKDTRVLLVNRSFQGFKNPVWLWPGGRLRGVETDLGDEARGVFKRETGCEVQLLSNEIEDARLVSVDGQGREIVNKYSPAPFLVMHQNRPQKHGVPGHVALLYVGTIRDTSRKLEEARLVGMERIRADEFELLEMWPDTKRSIIKAHDFWLERQADARQM